MPVDGNIWLEDPLDSYYPPSAAFIAAKMQDNHKTAFFLRRIKEMILIEKENISKPLPQEMASEYGVTATKFLFESNPVQLHKINALIEKNKLQLFIDKTFPLKDTKNALLYQKAGHSRGKNVLIVE